MKKLTSTQSSIVPGISYILGLLLFLLFSTDLRAQIYINDQSSLYIGENTLFSADGEEINSKDVVVVQEKRPKLYIVDGTKVSGLEVLDDVEIVVVAKKDVDLPHVETTGINISQESEQEKVDTINERYETNLSSDYFKTLPNKRSISQSFTLKYIVNETHSFFDALIFSNNEDRFLLLCFVLVCFSFLGIFYKYFLLLFFFARPPPLY